MHLRDKSVVLSSIVFSDGECQFMHHVKHSDVGTFTIVADELDGSDCFGRATSTDYYDKQNVTGPARNQPAQSGLRRIKKGRAWGAAAIKDFCAYFNDTAIVANGAERWAERDSTNTSFVLTLWGSNSDGRDERQLKRLQDLADSTRHGAIIAQDLLAWRPGRVMTSRCSLCNRQYGVQQKMPTQTRQ